MRSDLLGEWPGRSPAGPSPLEPGVAASGEELSLGSAVNVLGTGQDRAGRWGRGRRWEPACASMRGTWRVLSIKHVWAPCALFALALTDHLSCMRRSG